MKPLYITAVVTFSGKTALALGIGLKLKDAGRKIGYWKPISTQPCTVEGQLVDEDAAFVKRALDLDTPLGHLKAEATDGTARLTLTLTQDAQRGGRHFFYYTGGRIEPLRAPN